MPKSEGGIHRTEEREFRDDIEYVINALEKPKVQAQIERSVENVANYIIDVYSENPRTKFIFVVGGKSRQVTHVLLNKVAALLPPNHPAAADIRRKVRLTDSENKHLYSDITVCEDVDDILPEGDVTPLSELASSKTEFIFCEEVMDTGTKAFTTLRNLENNKMKGQFIIFASTGETSNVSPITKVLHNRPDNWQEYQHLIFTGVSDKSLALTLKKISSLISKRVSIHLNKAVLLSGFPVTLEWQDLTQSQREIFLQASSLLQSLKKILE